MTTIRVVLIIVATGWSCRALARAEVPEWVSFPEQEWETITPKKAGIDADKFNAWAASQNPRFGKASVEVDHF